MRPQASLRDVFAAHAHRSGSNVSRMQPVTPRNLNMSHKQYFSSFCGSKAVKPKASLPLLVVTNCKSQQCLQLGPDTDRSQRPLRSILREANLPSTPGRHLSSDRVAFQRRLPTFLLTTRDESKGSLVVGEEASKNTSLSISKQRADIKDRLGCFLEQGSVSSPKLFLKPTSLKMMLKGLRLKYRESRSKCCD